MVPNSNAPTRTLPPRNAQKILIVEDDYILAANLQENLESLGYNVVGTADSAEEAVNQAVQFQPDVILMDIHLRSDLDGIQAARLLWKTLRMSVIYLTGHSDQKTLERAQATLPFGYLLKPVKIPELKIALATAICCPEEP